MSELQDRVQDKLEILDAKIDKALGRDIKPIHYIMVGLLILSILSSVFT